MDTQTTGAAAAPNPADSSANTPSLYNASTLYTPAGMAVGVWMIGEVCSSVFDFRPKWLPLVLAVLFALLYHIRLHNKKKFTMDAIMIIAVNSCVIFFSAIGANSIKANSSSEAAVQAAGNSANTQHSSILFFDSNAWFPPKALEEENFYLESYSEDLKNETKEIKEENSQNLHAIATIAESLNVLKKEYPISELPVHDGAQDTAMPHHPRQESPNAARTQRTVTVVDSILRKAVLRIEKSSVPTMTGGGQDSLSVTKRLLRYADYSRGWYIVGASQRDSVSLDVDRRKIKRIVMASASELAPLGVNLSQSAEIWTSKGSDGNYKVVALYGIKDMESAKKALAVLKKNGLASDAFLNQW